MLPPVLLFGERSANGPVFAISLGLKLRYEYYTAQNSQLTEDSGA